MGELLVGLLALLLLPPLLVAWLLRWFWRLSKPVNSAEEPRPARWLGLLALAASSCLIFFYWLVTITQPMGSAHGPGPSVWRLEEHHYHTLIGVGLLGGGFTLLLALWPGRWRAALSFGSGLLLALTGAAGQWQATHHHEKQVIGRLYASQEQEQEQPTNWQTTVVDSFQKRKLHGQVEEVGFISRLPGFPGGESALSQAIRQRVRQPTLQNKLTGKVEVEFIVEADGRVTLVHVVSGLGAGYDEEAVRVVKSLPRFIPGRQDGHPVAVVWWTTVFFE